MWKHFFLADFLIRCWHFVTDFLIKWHFVTILQKIIFICLNEQITDFAIEKYIAHYRKLRIFFFLAGLFECIVAYRCRALYLNARFQLYDRIVGSYKLGHKYNDVLWSSIAKAT